MWCSNTYLALATYFLQCGQVSLAASPCSLAMCFTTVGYQSFNQTPTIRELMADKTKVAGLTLETSPALQEYLDHEHQLHLQMIEEQKQLEDLQKQKIQDQLEEEERRRKLEEQEIA